MTFPKSYSFPLSKDQNPTSNGLTKVSNKVKQIGLLTGGGDCPGLNSFLRVAVNRIQSMGFKAFGFRQSWEGLIENQCSYLTADDVEDLGNRGGTFLRSSKTFPFDHPDSPKKIVETFEINKLDALIAVGGESNIGVASKLQSKFKLPIIAVPKTIDNDVWGTDYSIGFSTSVDTVAHALDSLRDTAKSHSRLLVVEIMGRNTGWLAAYGGLAGMADLILVPEHPLSKNSFLQKAQIIQKSQKAYGLIAVAEGFKFSDQEKINSSIGKDLEDLLRQNSISDARAIILGHLQRGGSPNAFDRILATKFAQHAVELAEIDKTGQTVVFQKGKITSMPMQESVKDIKKLPLDFLSHHE